MSFRFSFRWPRSFMGRSCLILFAAPIVWRVIFYFWDFGKLLFYWPFRLPQARNDAVATPDLLSGYIKNIPYFIWNNLSAYAVEVAILAGAALPVCMVYRLFRNKPFGKGEYYSVWAVTFFALCVLPPFYVFYIAVTGGDSEDFGSFIESVVVAAALIYALCKFAKFVMLKQPYHTDGLWKSGMSARQFFGDNYAFFKTQLMQLGYYKLVGILLVILILDFCKFALAFYVMAYSP